MRYALSLILTLLMVLGANAGPIPAEELKVISKASVENAVTEAINKTLEQKVEEMKVNGIIPGPDTELTLVLTDLKRLPPDAQKHAAYFTLYNYRDVEEIKRRYMTLSVWIHYLSNQNVIRLPQLVDGGNGTLFRVDIRDYGWDLQSWENVSRADPYFREPVINHEVYSAIRLISGNVLVRADWFIDATSTPTKQIDNEQPVLYYELIYGKNIPKNKAEFYKFWRADIAKIEGRDGKPSLVQQMLIEEGSSGVALNNRVLARAPTELGYLWETSDFKNSNGARNVVNNLYPGVMQHPEADAGEFIASDFLGTQKFFITNQFGNRIDIADPGVAQDKTSKDARVIIGRSCVECHAGGINTGIDVLQEKILASNKLKFAEYTFKMQADSAYFGWVVDKETKLKESRLKFLMKQDSEHYDQAIYNIIGINGRQSAALFREALNEYDEPVTLEQAAMECGVSIQEFQEKVDIGINGQLTALANGSTISREEWEYSEYGGFQQAMLLIKGIGKTIKQSYGNISTETALQPNANGVLYIRVIRKTPLKVSTQVLAEIAPDTVFDVLEKRGDWYSVKYNKMLGWVNQKDVEEKSDELRP